MSRLTSEALLSFITDCTSPVTKRELARAFNVKGDERIELKRLLAALEADGLIVKQPGHAFSVPEGLPTVVVAQVEEVDIDGEIYATPTEWQEDAQGPAPRILILPDPVKGHTAMREGDRALVKVKRLSEKSYEGRVIRRLDAPQARAMGIVRRMKNGFVVTPTDKRAKYDYDLPQADLNGAREGDLVLVEVQPARGLHRKKVRVIENVGNPEDPKSISLIALHEAGIKPFFPEDVIAETQNMIVPDLKGREDMRDIPLVTIDGEDARDFDDAVFAEELEDGSFHLIVAIADVAFYVREGSKLDREAYRRGNSTYFPDRVVPMLPEKLSNDLCSLRPNENRACLAFHLWISANGKLLKHKVVRGIMRSAARLTYEQVQAAKDGFTDGLTGPLMDVVITPLYKAFNALWKARQERGALDLDLPERKIILNEQGRMIGVAPRERLDAHKLIEEFMILANVAAAESLEKRSAPCIYRVHDRPDPKKIESAGEFLATFGLTLPKGQVVKPAQINMILHKAAELPYSHLISQVILRSQSQAHYHPDNDGHFGLALARYAHFTSPIRRYADLLVHRALIRAYALGPGGLEEGSETRLEEMSQHISDTERMSMEAERNATDRFIASFLSDRIGAQFSGRITGATRFGLFVTLDESGADGLIPISTLPQDFYIHDERQHALIGQRHGRVYRMGANVRVTLAEADPITGSTILALIGDESADLPGILLKRPMPFKQGASGRRDGKTKRYQKGGGKKFGPKSGRPSQKGGRGPKGRG